MAAEPNYAAGLAAFYQAKRDLFCELLQDSRFKLQAADTPIDPPTVVGEVREAIAPVIGQFAHEALLATGALSQPERYSSEWEVFFAHLLAGFVACLVQLGFGGSSYGAQAGR